MPSVALWWLSSIRFGRPLSGMVTSQDHFRGLERTSLVGSHFHLSAMSKRPTKTGRIGERPNVYLTAQRIRNRDRSEEIHAFLHLHDIPGGGGFPSDPLAVPQDHPGRLVGKETGIVALGGNSVLSYLDVIAPDQDWREKPTEAWSRELESVGALMETLELPWVVDAGSVHVIFSAVSDLDARREYEALVDVALRLWETSRPGLTSSF